MRVADIVVIGGGPAGMAAAVTAAHATSGRVVLIDEASSLGGRLAGQLYRHNNEWVIGSHTAHNLAEAVYRAGVTVLEQRQVWFCEPVEGVLGWQVSLSDSETISARAIIIATGAAERPLPLPGWTLPGVLAVGAVQQLVQVQRILPGKRMAVIGTDPLAMSASEEIALGGGEVIGVYLPSGGAGQTAPDTPVEVLKNLSNFAAAAPAVWQRWGAHLMRHESLASVAARVLPRTGITVGATTLKIHHRVERILGDNQVEAISIAQIDSLGRSIGVSEEVPVDAVCVSGGLYPVQELTQGRCETLDLPELGGLVPLHSSDLRTTAEGLYVAGNVTGIEGAAVAQAQGILAGTAVAADLGAYTDARDRLESARVKVEHARATAVLTFLPAIRFGRQRMNELWAIRRSSRSEATDVFQ